MNLPQNQTINSIILSITDNCNLACKYCFVKHNTHEMSVDISKQAIDFLATNHIDSYKDITFFGGEPLLLWDKVIIPSILHAQKIDESIHFNITTNGILLNEEKLIFLKKNNVSLLLSMDGAQETQDFNRPFKNGTGSFQQLKENLPIILKYYPNITVRGTIYPSTCHNLFLNFKFFMDNNIKDVFFYPDEFSYWSEKDKQNLADEIRKISIYYLSAFTSNKIPINFSPFASKFKDLYLEEFSNFTNEDYCNSCCGLGNKVITIDYQGNIFGCQELSSYDLQDNPYLIGNLQTGINYEKYFNLKNLYKQSLLNISCEDEIYCKEKCEYKKLCKSAICHANSFIKFKNLNKKTIIKCFWDNLLYQECKMMFLILTINNNETFNNYYEALLMEGENKCYEY